MTRRILLIVSGGIAAYKALELARLLGRAGYGVTGVLTEAGARFITPLSLQALTGARVYTDLWSLTDESEMGHIELSRAADLVVVAPASADILARMAAGLARDMATTLLLATDKPVLVAPAMNVRMWQHAATQANLATLRARGVGVVGPDEGEMACGEFGPGRLAEPAMILAAIEALFAPKPLVGRHVLVTAGPTQEPIDPVRYLGNRSSGRQGFAIAAALAGRGARVSLVSGPVALADPQGVRVIRVQTGQEMLAACRAALPADAVVFAAAVADWRPACAADHKLKKADGAPMLALVANPDILALLAAAGPVRPGLVVGFAAETQDLALHAAEKRVRKNADWILANDVRPETGIMGGADNCVTLVDARGEEEWPVMSKDAVAARLAERIAAALEQGSGQVLMNVFLIRLAALPLGLFCSWPWPGQANCPVYGVSGPITVTQNGQVIENLVISSTNGPAIQVNGYSRVLINNVVIHLNGGQGIALAFAPGTVIANADIIFDGAPPAGADPSTNDNNIDCLKSDGLSVTNVRLTKGSSGIYLNQCRGSRLTAIEGHDQRGPFPRGQLVQWNNSDRGSLTNFSDENALASSWTEDNINVYQSRHVRIADGLVDTNNSPSGDGVIADNLSGDGLVEDVDAIHQGNGCFSAYGGGEFNVTFRQTRCRDNYCTLPRGNPLSGSLAWGLDPKAIKGALNIERSVYANLCNPNNIVFDARQANILQLKPVDFTARPPLPVQLCQYGC